jgi:hypothetical protein
MTSPATGTAHHTQTDQMRNNPPHKPVRIALSKSALAAVSSLVTDSGSTSHKRGQQTMTSRPYLSIEPFRLTPDHPRRDVYGHAEPASLVMHHELVAHAPVKKGAEFYGANTIAAQLRQLQQATLGLWAIAREVRRGLAALQDGLPWRVRQVAARIQDPERAVARLPHLQHAARIVCHPLANRRDRCAGVRVVGTTVGVVEVEVVGDLLQLPLTATLLSGHPSVPSVVATVLRLMPKTEHITATPLSRALV